MSLFKNKRGGMQTTTKTGASTSTRTKVLVTLGVVGLVVVAAFGIAFGPGFLPTKFPTPITTIIRAPIPTSSGTISSGSAARTTGFALRLSDWPIDVPAGTDIAQDPIGAVMQSFWLDPAGTICNGTPGVSGQPGTHVLTPTRFRTTATAVTRGTMTSLTADELPAAQIDTLPLDSYGATGSQILLAQAAIWRTRATGALFVDATSRLSQFIDATFGDSVLTPATLRPKALLSSASPCLTRDRDHLPVPSTDLSAPTTQHPTLCRTRQAVTAAALQSACNAGRLQGSLSEGFLRIMP